MELNKCSKCDPEHPHHWGRCKEHQTCDDCGTAQGLCCYSEGLLCRPCREVRCEAKVNECDISQFGHELTHEPVCPHCGYDDHSDTFEWGTSGEHYCCNCDRRFSFSVEYNPEWTTRKL